MARLPTHRTATARPDGNWITRHPAASFVILAYALSWCVWPFTAVNPDSVAVLSVGPLIAALAVAGLVGGRRGVVALLRAMVRWRAHWTWYVVALAGPFLLTALAGAVTVAVGAVGTSQLGDYGRSTSLSLPLLLVSTALVGGPLFEEPGWRGFLLPQLQRGHTAIWSTAVVGVVWATWHLPLLVSEPTTQRLPVPFVLWILAQAVLLTWLYNGSSGSVLMAIGFHTTANTATRILFEPFVGQEGFAVMWWLLAVVYCLAAALVLWWTRGALGPARATSVGSASSRISVPATRRPASASS